MGARLGCMGPMRDLGDALYGMQEREIPDITFGHFNEALGAVRPSVAKSDLETYLKWNETFGTFRT